MVAELFRSGPSCLILNGINMLMFIQKELAQKARAKGRYTQSDAYIGVSDRRYVTKPTLKRSKFHACILTIGAWQWLSRYDGDLVAKFCYENNKLVWVIHEGLKSNIEIDCENISALSVTCPEGGPGTLEITLSQRPKFSKETNQQLGKSTEWLQTTDFTGGQASIHRRHVLQCAPGILNKHIVTLLSSNHRLYSLSQENIIVQQNPYFEQWHSEYEIPKSSNAQDLYHPYNDYQRVVGQKFGQQVPVSVGTNIVGRNHIGSLVGKHILTGSSDLGGSYMFTIAPSGGLQQHRDISNWSNSSLQMGPQAQLNIFNEPRQSSAGNGAPSSGLEQHRNTSLQTPPQAHLNFFGGAPSAGLQQHRDMFNWNAISVKTLRQAQINFSRGRASVASGGLEQHRNMYPSLPIPPRQAQLKISSGSRIMDDTMNSKINPRKRRNPLASMGTSPDNVVQSEDVRMLVKDIRSSAKSSASSWDPKNYSVGSWSRSSRELESNNYAINNTTAQTFKQINSAILPGEHNVMATAAVVLDKISNDLLEDVDIEPTGSAEEAMVMSTVNSLSDLLQQEPATATAGTFADPVNVSAEAAITKLLGEASDAGSSGGSCNRAGGGSDNSMLHSTATM